MGRPTGPEGYSMDLAQLLIAIIALIIGWVIISIPLWLAAKVLTGGQATMGEAMLGMLLGGIVFALVYVGTFIVTNTFTSSGVAVIVAAIIALLAFLGLYKFLFDVGWLRALAIAILAVIFAIMILVIISAILVVLGVNALGM